MRNELNGIEGIAVTRGPAWWVLSWGSLRGQGRRLRPRLPFVGVNHMDGTWQPSSSRTGGRPFLAALVVSGGHPRFTGGGLTRLRSGADARRCGGEGLRQGWKLLDIGYPVGS